MKIVFFGTNYVSNAVFKKLKQESIHEIVAVVTQEVNEKDLKKSRINHELFADILEKNTFPKDKVFTPKKASDPEFIKTLKSLEPDLFVVISYGQILKKELLDVPKYGIINIHYSKLPHLRGASPVQWAILNGEKETGISFIKMTQGLDDGPILFSKDYKIDPNWNSKDALSFLAEESAVEFNNFLNNIKTGEDLLKVYENSPSQDHDKATFCYIIKKEMGEIDFRNDDDIVIMRKNKAFFTWPGTYFKYQGSLPKIKQGSIVKLVDLEGVSVISSNTGPGEFFSQNGELYIQTTKNPLLIKRIQLEGKNIITGQDFVRGYMS